MSETVFEKACQLAKKYHKDQKYGEQDYYDYHLMNVTRSIVHKWGEGNQDLLAIAILHDILEDTDLTEQELRKVVGKDVTKCVVALTKMEGEQYDAYIHRVKEFHYSKEVKIHDTLCNLTESIMSDSAYRVKKYSNQLQLLVK